MQSAGKAALQTVISPVWKPVLAGLLAIAGTTSVCAGVNVWTAVGPEGGLIRALAVDPKNPGVVYALTGGSFIFKSSDGAGSWSALDPGLPCCVSAVAIDPQDANIVYAGTSGTGIIRSQDGGTSWRAANSGLPANAGGYTAVTVLLVDPNRQGTVYAGTENGVFKSSDGAASWSAASSGLLFYLSGSVTNVVALAMDPQNTSTIFAAVGSYCCPASVPVFKSTGEGENWNPASFGLPTYPDGRYYVGVNGLAIDPGIPGTLYAVTASGVFKSSDAGGSWVNSAVPRGVLVFDPQNPGTIYSGTDKGIFKSTDGGANWNPASSGLSASLSGGALCCVSALAIDPQSTGTLYAGSGMSGAFKSSDGGASWNPASSGMLDSYISDLAIDPEDSAKLYAAAGLVFKSGDGGAHWKALNFGPQCCVSALAIGAQDPNTIYAGARGGGVWKSDDGGVSWVKLAEFDVAGIAIDPANTDTVYVGASGGGGTGEGGVWKSTDGGANWVKFVMPRGGGVRGLTIDPQSPGTLFAWNGMGLFTSADKGETWSILDSTPPRVLALAIDPRNFGIIYAISEFDGVLKSTDGGITWSAVNSGLPTDSGVRVLSIDPHNPDVIYGAALGRGVFKSIDGGASWSAVNSGLTTLSVNTIAIDPRNMGTVYAGTLGGGVFAITFVP